jgi:hypothetical protein
MIKKRKYIFSIKQIISCSDFFLLHIISLLEKQINYNFIDDSDNTCSKVITDKLFIERERILNINEVNLGDYIFISTSLEIPLYIKDVSEIFYISDDHNNLKRVIEKENINSILCVYSPLMIKFNCINLSHFTTKYYYITPSYKRLTINFDENTKPIVIYDENTDSNFYYSILKSLKQLNTFEFLKFDNLFDFNFKEIRTSKILSLITSEIKDSYIKSCTEVQVINLNNEYIFNDILYNNKIFGIESKNSLRSTISLFIQTNFKNYKKEVTNRSKLLNIIFCDIENLEFESLLNLQRISINENTIKAFFLYKLFKNENINFSNFHFFKLLFKYTFKDNSLSFISLINEIYNYDSDAFIESLFTIFTRSTDSHLKNDTTYYFTRYVVRSQIVQLLNQGKSEFLSNNDILHHILKTSLYINTLVNLSILFYYKGNMSNVDVVIQNCTNQSSKNLMILNLLIACTLKNDDFNFEKYLQNLDFSNHHTSLEIVLLQTKILNFLRPGQESVKLELNFNSHSKISRELILFNDVILIVLHVFSKLNNYKLPHELSSYIKNNILNVEELNFSQFEFLNLDSSSFDESILDSFNQ